MFTATPLADLASRISGRVVTAADPAWDEVRQVFNLTTDLHPAAIVLPCDAVDVAITVDFARAHGLQVAPQATGHNAAALGSIPDTLLIDVRELREIQIDVEKRRVRVGAGVRWQDVVPRLSELGLAALHGSSPSSASPATPSEEGWAGWRASTASRPTASPPSRW